MSDLERLIDGEAKFAELHRNDPIPDDAPATRPNRTKSVMFSLRLNPDEVAAVHTPRSRARGVRVRTGSWMDSATYRRRAQRTDRYSGGRRTTRSLRAHPPQIGRILTRRPAAD